MRRRIVITGMGAVTPFGERLSDLEKGLRQGRNAIKKIEKLEEMKFSCQVAGCPPDMTALAQDLFTEEQRFAMNSNMTYACIAAVEAWSKAGLTYSRSDNKDENVDWDTGAIIGTGIGGLDTAGTKLIPMTDSGKVRRLGSSVVEQVMASSSSAKIAGLFGLGNQVTTNSSACSTSTEAIYMACQRILSGKAKRMLAGGSEGSSHYTWAGFDAMKVLARGFNDRPDQASRPMSARASGFVPAAGAGVLVLEDYETAVERGAPIYAEILGGAVNCGGQRMGGTMTAPNSEGVRRCIREALDDAGIGPEKIDAISGHLTATQADPIEVRNWSEALNAHPSDLPTITATKSLIGHALGAAGAIETIAAVLMLEGGFIHASKNCEDLHPDIKNYSNSIPQEAIKFPELRTIVKAGFGFGDVNGCLVLEKTGEQP